ncbi:unnamed protein product [Effrenium voratum]|uniref:Uncharacterized protein n=2 Tax=Effrenium voratum TaxID=2562239 RepID=A0AA36I444_9DINO|nr:unnamed protein product [Effrenium voratum]
MERCGCLKVAAWPAPVLASALRAELLSAEVVSGFSTEVNASFFSFSLDEAEKVTYYENLWEIWVRNHAQLNNYTHCLDWVESSYFGMKPFQEHAHPTSMAEARERSAYFLLNSLRVDEGSPLYGDVSVVLLPSFARRVSVLSPFDSGSWSGLCNHSFVTPNTSYAHNCSAFSGRGGLGTFQAFDHLFEINERYWAKPEAFLQPLARLLGPEGSTGLVGENFVQYFEVLPTARVEFTHVKFIIAAFPSLFGTDRGERVQRWCRRNGLMLVWSLGLNVGFTTDHGMPHFWDVQKQRGPFYSNQRLMDPGVLRTSSLNATAAAEDVAAFSAAWQLLASERRRHLEPADFNRLWASLTANLSHSLQIAPLRAASCADLDRCIGVTRLGCLCKKEAAVVV